MLRMPSACAPSRSLWIAMRFRSRDVKWMIGSMPMSRAISTASATRAHAHARHGAVADVDAVDAERSSRCAAPSSALRGLRPRGGSSSTLTTNSPAASFSRSVRRGCSSPLPRGWRGDRDGRRSRRRATRDAATAAPPRRFHSWPRASRIAEMCSGVVPQQPPTMFAPASTSLRRVLGEVLRRRGVDEAAVEEARQAGVRHRGEAHRRLRGHRFDDLERGLRAEAAVDARDVGAERGGDVRDFVRRLAAHCAAVALERHLRDDRQVARLLHGEHRLAQLGEVGERLEDEQIDAALEQRLDLLAERRAHLLRPDVADGREHAAGRADRAGDEDRMAADLARVAGEARGAEVDLAHAIDSGRDAAGGSGSRRRCWSR